MSVTPVTIPTITSVTVLASSITIVDFYAQGQGFNNIIIADIKDTIGTQGGEPFTENELIMVVKNYLNPLNVYINSIGELIIDDDNANQYQINAAGELEFVE